MRNTTALLVILAIPIVSSCGGSADSKTGGASAQQPSMTAAQMMSKVQAESSAGHPEAALQMAHELIAKFAAAPEAAAAVKLLPGLEKAAKAAVDAERARQAAKAAEIAHQRLADKWSYRVEEDKMTSRKARYASIDSENTVNFGFPYQGEQHATLLIRDHPTYGHDVVVSIEKGQILCRSYEDCQIRVRFDDGTAERWSAIGPSDNSSTTIFLRGETRFVQKLRAAKRLRVQVPIYEQGEPLFEFQVGGFDYPRYQGSK